MKRLTLLLTLAALCAPVLAQQPSEANDSTAPDGTQLGEAVVSGARMVQKVDRQLFYPSDHLKDNSPTGYALLKKLALPAVTVDEVKHTVRSVKGDVLVRINDEDARPSELLSLEMKAVRRIEYVDTPGLRYGDNVAAVINIITRQATAGVLLGGNADAAFTAERQSGGAYAKVNSGRSEWSADYSTSLHNLHGDRTEMKETFQLADGTQLERTQHISTAADRVFSHDAQLRYAYSHTDHLTFQTTLSLSRTNTPRSASTIQMLTDGQDYTANRSETVDDWTPGIETYLLWKTTSRQTFIADLSGSLSRGASTMRYDSPALTTAYDLHRRMRYAGASALYEWQLRPFTLTIGGEWTAQVARNRYAGDTEADSRMHKSFVRGYVDVKGRLLTIDYNLSVGLSSDYRREAAERMRETRVRTLLTLGHNFGKGLYLRYSFTNVPQQSRVANTSAVMVRRDELLATRGNPDLKPSRKLEQQIDFISQCTRFTNTLTLHSRLFRNPSGYDIERTDDNLFIRTDIQQKACRFHFVSDYVQCHVIPDRLVVSLYGGYYHMYNSGKGYARHFGMWFVQGQADYTLGRFNLMAYGSSAWRHEEGNARGVQRPSGGLRLTYRAPVKHGHALTLTAYAEQPFVREYRTTDARTFNVLHQSSFRHYSSSDGNLFGLSLTWHWAKGRRFDGVSQRLSGGKGDRSAVK